MTAVAVLLFLSLAIVTLSRLRAKQFRVSAPMVGPLFTDDADYRRVEHDLDAIRARFESHPVWPSSGATGERR